MFICCIFLDTQSGCLERAVLETWMDYQVLETMARWMLMNSLMCIAMWKTFTVS